MSRANSTYGDNSSDRGLDAAGYVALYLVAVFERLVKVEQRSATLLAFVLG